MAYVSLLALLLPDDHPAARRDGRAGQKQGVGAHRNDDKGFGEAI
jgi:hypothetical protein